LAADRARDVSLEPRFLKTSPPRHGPAFVRAIQFGSKKMDGPHEKRAMTVEGVTQNNAIV
jgi:hypothetical protein